MPKLPASVSVHAPRRPRALSPSAEDCLERISELITAKGYARYRGLTLTPKGIAAAKQQLHRRAVLIEFFNLLGLDTATVTTDVEGMEHHLSDNALAKLEMLVVALRRASLCPSSDVLGSLFRVDR